MYIWENHNKYRGQYYLWFQYLLGFLHVFLVHKGGLMYIRTI